VQYIVRDNFAIDVGFVVNSARVIEALELTNNLLGDLPSSLYRSIDYKTTSSMVGALFCESLASRVDCIVNPIEKGHPDLIPKDGAACSEEELRNYPKGLEVKTTVGNIEKGANLRAGEIRVGRLVGITWQAHHREVKELMGLVWDFVRSEQKFNSPAVTGVFYSDGLTTEDWGEISGTTGRNTKVTGMRSSGKLKMGAGWVALLHDEMYMEAYSRHLRFER
jgi:hypothetical protein